MNAKTTLSLILVLISTSVYAQEVTSTRRSLSDQDPSSQNADQKSILQSESESGAAKAGTVKAGTAKKQELDFGQKPSGKTENSSPGSSEATTGSTSNDDVVNNDVVVEDDVIKQLNARAAAAHKNLAFENDFSYLEDPFYSNPLFGDGTKRIAFGPNIKLDVGGQYRIRLHSEDNMRGAVGSKNKFQLHRNRLYTNLEVGNFMRVFIEGIDAVSFDEDLAPRGIDENRFDFLNAFVDTRLLQGENANLTFRIGRQELSFGDQRVVSNLDWANTRRTFHGYRMIWNGPMMNTSFFYTNPMRKNLTAVDSINYGQEFYGSYTTFKAFNTPIDVYYLVLNRMGTFAYQTAGSRIKGNNGMFSYDLEGSVQWGKDGGGTVNHRAEAYTIGFGKQLANRPFKPAFWAYYDWASGARGGGLGYHHNFPLSHKYLGFMDFFGRRNIGDLNFQFSVQPHERLKTMLWYHDFQRLESTDTLYNVAMTPFGAAGGSNDIGQEIDLITSIKLAPRANLILGYSRFFSGAFFETNAGLPFSRDSSFYYTQFQVNY